MSQRTSQPPPGRPRAGKPGLPAPSVTQRVVEAILSELRSGRFQVGDRLPSERELIESLGVGRSAVREATRDLVALGLVEIQRGRGTYVRSLRSDLLIRQGSFGDRQGAAAELLEVRLIIEPAAASLAALRASEGDLARLDEDVRRLADAVEAGYRPPEDLGFHLDVVHATHNRSLARVTGAIVSFYQVDEHLPTQQDVLDHQAVLDAIRARATEHARTAMRCHLERELTR